MTQKAVIFFANSSSPHVRHWIQMIDGRLKVTVIDIYRSSSLVSGNDSVACRYPLPFWARKLPKVLQYVLLGLWAWIYLPDENQTHVHNASGFGLVGLISRHKYALVIYGSELFSMPQKSIAYRQILKTVIRRAHTIYTSAESTKLEVAKIAGSNQRMVSFSHGIARKFTIDTHARTRNNRIWICNRRIHELYNTIYLVEAFKQYCQKHQGKGKLVLIEGDGDPKYINEVRKLASEVPSIDIVPGFLGAGRLSTLLDEASFCISIPNSDQLSTSILEAAGRGCISVLHDLPSYASVKDISILLPSESVSVEGLTNMFLETSRLSHEQVATLSQKSMALIDANFSIEQAFGNYMKSLDRK